MTKENPAITAFKIWVFPGLVSIMGMMIWHEVSEIKSDVKLLLAQMNVDKTRIDNLEREVFNKAKTASYPIKPEEPRANQYAVLTDNKIKFR